MPIDDEAAAVAGLDLDHVAMLATAAVSSS